MGIYVDIWNNHGQRIASGKYGVGYAILMFSRFEKEKKKFRFVADGIEAVNNLEKYLAYVDAHMTLENEDRLLPIKNKLLEVRKLVSENNSYVLDYSEIMNCMVSNPCYNPMRPVVEMAEKIDDAIYGYNRFGCKDTVAIKIMQAYIQSLYAQLRVSSIVHEMKHNFVFTVTIHENSDDKHYLDTVLLRPVEDNDDWQVTEYYQRKLFMILKQSGLKFEWLEASGRSAYIIIDKEYMQELVDSKPFVVCSYRWNTTCDIYYLLPNNPDEKEKLCCYLKAQNDKKKHLESLVIDGVELLTMSDDEVATYIGKKLTFANYDYRDITMFEL